MIRYFTQHHLVRYIISGGTGAVTNLTLLYLLTDVLALHYILSGVIAFLCAVIVSFILQKNWTFEDTSTHATHKKFITFVVVGAVNLIVNTTLLYVFTDIVGTHYLLSQVFASGIIAIWSYFAYKVVFKNE